MKILAAFALPEEVVKISLSGCDVQTVITGITKPYAAANLAHAIVTHRPDAVLNIGTSGTQHFSVGDILVCNRFIDRDIARQGFDSASPVIDFSSTTHVALAGTSEPSHKESVESRVEGDEAPKYFPLTFPSLVGGIFQDKTFTVNTGDDFVTEADKIDGDAIDMEAFADALVCRKFGVPFLSIKYITDVVGQNSMQVWEDRLESARKGLAAYFEKIDL